MNDLERIFRQNEGRLIHKWIHYFEIYDRYFSAFRGRDIRVLEIGVFHGGSLQMWKQYFGEQALIVGMDINPRVEALGEAGIEIVVGDQSDPEFLRSVVDRFGPFDIVIDDGSHVPAHQIASIEHLWPTLPENALYVVEDLHTNYWEHFGGGKGADDTFSSGSANGWTTSMRSTPEKTISSRTCGRGHCARSTCTTAWRSSNGRRSGNRPMNGPDSRRSRTDPDTVGPTRPDPPDPSEDESISAESLVDIERLGGDVGERTGENGRGVARRVPEPGRRLDGSRTSETPTCRRSPGAGRPLQHHRLERYTEPATDLDLIAVGSRRKSSESTTSSQCSRQLDLLRDADVVEGDLGAHLRVAGTARAGGRGTGDSCGSPPTIADRRAGADGAPCASGS